MDVSTNKIRLDTLEIQYDEAGCGDRSLVLLHGLTGHRKDFELAFPALAAHGRTLAPDLRGHGNSSRPSVPRGYDFDTLVEDFRRLLDSLDIERCDLLGHSFGGMLALRFVLEHPDRVDSLVLVSTSSEAPDVLQRKVFVNAGAYVEREGMEKYQFHLEEFGRGEQVPLADDATPDQQDWRRRYWAHHRLRLCAMDRYAYGTLGLAMMDQLPVIDRLGEIRCPTTVIIGTADAEFLRGSENLAAGIQQATYKVLTGVGHHPQQESREAFVKIVGEHLALSR